MIRAQPIPSQAAVLSRRPPPAISSRQPRQFLARRCRPLAASCAGSDEPSTSGWEFVQVTVKKPLGLVLVEKKTAAETGEVVVEEILPNSNAAATGAFQVGDVLAKTSATVLKSTSLGTYGSESHGQRLYDNWETVEFSCEGESFDTVMTAIASNNERWGIKNVTLTVKRPRVQG